MWKSRRAFHSKNRRQWHIDTSKIRSDFEKKYVLGSVLAFSLVLIAAAGPAFYFFIQNQGIFTKAAYQSMPGILEYLERETIWFSIYFFCTLTFSSIFAWVYVRKVTSHLISPILVLQNQIKETRQGRSPLKKVQVRDRDEFQELISEYNLLVEELEKRNIDLSKPHLEPRSSATQANDHAEDFEPPRDSRHVS